MLTELVIRALPRAAWYVTIALLIQWLVSWNS